MCSSKIKLQGSSSDVHDIISPNTVSDINGRPVLQPTCNRVPLLDRHNSLNKKGSPKSSSAPLQPLTPSTNTPKSKPSLVVTPPISPKLKPLRSLAIKRGNDPNGLNSSVEKVVTPRNTGSTKSLTPVKKSQKYGGAGVVAPNSVDGTSSSLKFVSSLILEGPGSIVAARREQVAIMQVERRMKIAHYGRTKSAKYQGKVVPLDSNSASDIATVREEKRCSFITSNSDPMYVAYHDEEWGVPAHDDKLLFELLVLTGAQVGSDWTSVLKKREAFREAFSGFDAETVSKFSEKKISSINADYGIELSQIRGVVDNANRILEIKKAFGSFDKYLWGFVNHKPIATQYKSSHKMPVKTSKSEGMSKDMVRRSFRFVGPTVMHSFMQAAGLTNDHLTTCPRHLQCVALESQLPTVAPAL
ncbi:DNA glycosylase superfamily protein [Actinidia rufa]|uniref:DNA glycosylase superfamily protein n=1 Tax=Actinidia rufa TaxID=165716 RepID=A0A7J0FQM7_9ERIC|nr:DNA glycosylase superfamily protein [Actinidia rufa]